MMDNLMPLLPHYSDLMIVARNVRIYHQNQEHKQIFQSRPLMLHEVTGTRTVPVANDMPVCQALMCVVADPEMILTS